MRILALETTERIGSVAALQAGRVVELRRLPAGERTARSLIPTIDALLGEVGWRPADLELVGVSIGPGSFTGLRVGLAAAKTLAYSVGAEILGVATPEAIAARAPANSVSLEVVIDAQRQQLFATRYDRAAAAVPAESAGEGAAPTSLRCTTPTRLVDAAAWLADLRPPLAVTGPGLRRLRDPLSAGVEALPEELWPPTAAEIGQLAWRHHQAGHRDDLWKLTPDYGRKSAAEEREEGRRKEGKERRKDEG